MRAEKNFNRRTAELIEVQSVEVSAPSGHALGLNMCIKSALQPSLTLSLHMTPDEAFKLGQRLMAAATSAADN